MGHTVFAGALRWIARLVIRHPKPLIVTQWALMAVCVVYTCFHLKFDMSRDNLVGADKKYHQVFMKFQKEFPVQDQLAVVVESESPERNRQFVERLAAKLALETNLLTDIFYKGDLASLGPKALLFVPLEDLKEMRQQLAVYGPFINQFTEATNLNSFFELINKQFRTVKRETNAENTALLGAIPALQRIISQAIETLSMPGRPVSPGVNALFGAGAEAQQRMYITFATNRIYLVTARTRGGELIPQAVKRVRTLLAQTEMEVPGLNVGLTGEPVLDYDEMVQSEKDSTRASVVSLLLCALIFIYSYHGTGRPLKAVACLIVGLSFSMGFTTLTIGHLNILTITFAPILIGLAIDFGVHFISRFEEEIRKGWTPEQAVETAMVFTGQGIVTGAFTTATAFLAMGFTDFKGIQEMGIISGGGLILCLIPMLTMLPAMLIKGRQNVLDHEGGMPGHQRARIERLWLDRPGMVLGLALALCGAAALQFHQVTFDYNLLDMQSKGLPAVVYEKKLLFSGTSVLYAAVLADSLEQARQFEEKLKGLPSVASVDGSDRGPEIYDLLTRDQTSKLALVREIKDVVSHFQFARVETNSVPELNSAVKEENPHADESPLLHLPTLSTTLYSTMGYLGWAAVEAEKSDPKLAAQLRAVREAISDFRVKILSDDPLIPQRLDEYQQALFDDIHQTFEALMTQDTDGRLTPDDLPPALRSQFVGQTGKYLVQVFPAGDIWRHDVQGKFISEIRSALGPYADRLTGTPVQLYEYTTLLKDSYEQAALYALAVIAVMVYLHFRSLPCVVLALLPVAIGSSWTLGWMGLTDLPFNPADIMTLPLVVGIGVTNGIQILNRVAEEGNTGILAKSTGKAVLVSGLTAIVGFGSLALGRHQGIQSLGLVMATGIAACLIAALSFLPALLHILERVGWSVVKNRPSSSNAEPLLDLEEPRYKPQSEN
jgi:hopanoid biosynthesis associated RND transporter like protein HpnN